MTCLDGVAAAAGQRRRAHSRRVGVLAALGVGLGAASLTACRSSPEPSSRVVVVDAVAPPGGDGSAAAPWNALQAALEQGGPGVEIQVRAGVYRGPFRTVRGGTGAAPLRIVGRGATLIAGPDERVLTVANDHVVLSGLQVREGEQLVVLEGARNVSVLDSELRDAGGECLRLKAVQQVRVEGNTIDGCGQRGFDLERSRHDGEGISIGTAPEQVSGAADASNDVTVRGNAIRTPAACIEVKEGTSGVLIEDNRCRGGRDPDGGGISVRGDGNVVRRNEITDQAGAGIRVGGDRDGDGVDNEVQANTITEVDGYAVEVLRHPQRRVCGNTVVGADAGLSNDITVDPTVACDDGAPMAAVTR